MKTILFTWNPNRWSWDDLQLAEDKANVEGKYVCSWSCGNRKDISTGDRAFLMRLGAEPKGIMGSGTVISDPTEAPHWDTQRAAEGKMQLRVEVVFEILNEKPILNEEDLSVEPLNQHNWYPQASGTIVPEKVSSALENIWTNRTGSVYIPINGNEAIFLRSEGRRQIGIVTRYERDSKARVERIKHFGESCKVCGLSFQKRYGLIGSGFIHVHHLIPLSKRGAEYQVNPINDLRPVCPNCHAMLHKKTPPFSIDELKNILEKAEIESSDK